MARNDDLSPLSPMASTLRGSLLFTGVEARLLERFVLGCSRRAITRGEALFHAGETASAFTLITAGLVKVSRLAPDGGERILGLFGPREGVGTVAVLQRERFPATALAVSERVEAIRLEAGPVLEVMPGEPSLALALNRALLYHTRILHEKIGVMSAGGVPQRLASLLLTLAERFGDEVEGGALFAPVGLSRGEISALIGARVETTIRVLSRWQKEGLARIDREGFWIERPAHLRDLASGTEREDDG